ncbi:MAG TPA: methyltransferase domain-containing protein [Caulobacteraceae bacterium]|jgi:predicted methyltransferase|nr:methyltransferase domain-containing protein [Caulobacteraceae bacterium]
MKARYFAAAAAVVLASGATLAQAAGAIPANIAAAVASPSRPDADKARDEARKPAEVLAFAGVKPGEQVLELIPGGGYFTRVLSGAVGPSGHVTEAVPQVGGGDMSKNSNGVAADPHFGNVTEVAFTPDMLGKTPGQYDLIWTSQNYHDLHLPRLSLDVPGLDKQIFAALKPGGEFFIEDHAAAPGADVVTTADTLHRIDEAAVKKEVEAAGFEFVGESPVLHNPADDHTLKVFDPAIRGHTDQFLLKFRKPA